MVQGKEHLGTICSQIAPDVPTCAARHLHINSAQSTSPTPRYTVASSPNVRLKSFKNLLEFELVPSHPRSQSGQFPLSLNFSIEVLHHRVPVSFVLHYF